MIAPAVTAVLSAWWLGVLIAAVAWPRARAWRSDLALILPLGAILGFGVTSVTFFVASLVSSRPAVVGGAIEFTAAVVLIWRLCRQPAAVTPASGSIAPEMTWLHWALATLFVQGAVVAGVTAWRAYAIDPYGGWDGWAIWNLQARFMLRAGPAWPDLLAAPQLNWTHPDYPRLLPASVARLWAWAGAEPPFAAGLVSVGFAIAIVGLLMALVARRHGRTPALLGGLLLLGTPFFVTFSSNEHADIPLASFMLGAIALLVLAETTPAARGLWALAGLAGGFAAWTKNEGILFAVVFGALAGWRAWRAGSPRDAAFFLGGLALGLLPVVGFKFLLAPANDLMGAPLGPRLAQLWDGARHRLILVSLWRDLGAFGEWRVLPYVAMGLPFLAWRWRRVLLGPERAIPAMIGLMLTGFYAVYLLSPQDLAWHLDTSLVRLLLQLWPLALLLWCLSLPSVGPGETGGLQRRWTAVVFAIANTIAGVGLVATLSGELPANELAAARGGRAALGVTLGEGWFGLEQRGKDRWAWSRGNATLLVHREVGRSGSPVALRFELRSLAPRQVTIETGGVVLWAGAVPTGAVQVEIPARTFPGGATALSISTDAPGVPEGPDAGARTLVFAVYNVRVR